MQTAQTLAFHNFLAATDIPHKKNLFAVLIYMPTLLITTSYILNQNTMAFDCQQPIYPWHSCSLQRRKPDNLSIHLKSE